MYRYIDISYFRRKIIKISLRLRQAKDFGSLSDKDKVLRIMNLLPGELQIDKQQLKQKFESYGPIIRNG